MKRKKRHTLDKTKYTKQTATGGTPPLQDTDEKPRRRVWWWVFWLLMASLAIYFIVQVFFVLKPRMRTQVALQDTMTDSVTASGFVVLQYTPITAADGVLHYTVPLGQRVSAGAEVAQFFAGAEGAQAKARLNKIEEQEQLLQMAENTYAEGGDADVYLKQLQDGMLHLVSALENENYSRFNDAENEVSLAANRLQIVTGEAVNYEEKRAALNSEKERLEAVATPLGAATAPTTGFFVPSSGQTQRHYSYDDLAATTPNQLQQKLKEPPRYHSEDTIGYIVEDYKWSFFTVVPIDDAEKFTEGAKLNIMFPNVSDKQVPVVVKSITADDGEETAKIELFCEQMNPEIMQLSMETAELIFKTEKGIRIDKNAMRIIEDQRCVYVKFGNQVFKRNIDVLLEDENYLLVSPVYQDGVNEIELYDIIVIDSGGVELYDKRVL